MSSALDILRLCMDVAGATAADGKLAALFSVQQLLATPTLQQIQYELIRIDAQYEVATKQARESIAKADKARKEAYDDLVKRLRKPPQEIKGGQLAKRAAICCGEGRFRAMLGVKTAVEARAEILRRCGITSRKLLDHDDRAAEIWRKIDATYLLWQDGHDVELD